MEKKLLQTPDFIKEQMLKRFADTIPGLSTLRTYPFLSRNKFIPPTGDDKTDLRLGIDYPSWIWLIPNNAVIYCQKDVYGYQPQAPADIKTISFADIDLIRNTRPEKLKLLVYEAEYKRPGKAPMAGYVLEIQSNIDNVIFNFGLAEMTNCRNITFTQNAGISSSWKEILEDYIGTKFFVKKCGSLFDHSTNGPLITYIETSSGNFDKQTIYNFPIIKDLQELLIRKDEIFTSCADDEDIKLFLEKLNNPNTSKIAVVVSGISDDGNLQLKIDPYQ